MTDAEIQTTADRLLELHTSLTDGMGLADERRDLIRTLVEQAGWSQMQVAGHLGITHQRVSQLLATLKPPLKPMAEVHTHQDWEVDSDA